MTLHAEVRCTLPRRATGDLLVFRGSQPHSEKSWSLGSTLPYSFVSSTDLSTSRPWRVWCGWCSEDSHYLAGRLNETRPPAGATREQRSILATVVQATCSDQPCSALFGEPWEMLVVMADCDISSQGVAWAINSQPLAALDYRTARLFPFALRKRASGGSNGWLLGLIDVQICT